MKRELTLRFFIYSIIALQLSLMIYMFANVITMKTNFAFTDNFYNLRFSCGDFRKNLMNDLEKGKSFKLSKSNEKVIAENGIWVQIFDESNKKVYGYNNSNKGVENHLLGELIKLSQNSWSGDNPVSLSGGTFDKDGKKYSLIIGYPPDKLKFHTLMFTDESLYFHIILLMVFVMLILITGYLFSKKLASPIADIIEDVNGLKLGNYIMKKKKKDNIYDEVNKNILELSKVLKQNEEERRVLEKSKEEWIANIAHDLKTPLASINGYAQVLLDGDYNLSREDAKRYAEIILDKTKYIQELIGDLSLIYKIKSKVLPLELKSENLIEITRDIVIDILNNPKYQDRNINLNYSKEEIYMDLDKKYMKRALNNFLFNAIIHNPKDTEINITIEEKSGINIIIDDNGQGISSEDLLHLFDRYYRGTNTGESHKGSGLGMAISKEILELHGGMINVKSELEKGTKVQIKF